jgi:hypothetical protein
VVPNPLTQRRPSGDNSTAGPGTNVGYVVRDGRYIIDNPSSRPTSSRRPGSSSGQQQDRGKPSKYREQQRAVASEKPPSSSSSREGRNGGGGGRKPLSGDDKRKLREEFQIGRNDSGYAGQRPKSSSKDGRGGLVWRRREVVENSDEKGGKPKTRSRVKRRCTFM